MSWYCVTFLSGNKGDAESTVHVPDAPKMGKPLLSKYSCTVVCSSSEDISDICVFLCVVGERARGERKQVGVSDLTLMLMSLRLFTNKAQKYAGLENVPDRERSKGTIKAEGGLITTCSHL